MNTGISINLIAAVGKSGQIGLDGELPWYDPRDLAWFRFMTMNNIVVVGWRTAQKLPQLPGRELIVFQRGGMSIDEIIRYANAINKDIFVCGGAATYDAWMHKVGKLLISKIDYDGPADTFMDVKISCRTAS
jgi:dihydrofolate reductase